LHSPICFNFSYFAKRCGQESPRSQLKNPVATKAATGPDTEKTESNLLSTFAAKQGNSWVNASSETPLAQGLLVSQSPRSLVVHCLGMKPTLKEIGIRLLIVLGLIALAVLRAVNNILNRS
jgi:hypothetical protein